MNDDEFTEYAEEQLGIVNQDLKEERAEIFKELDANGDDKITYQEVTDFLAREHVDFPLKVVQAAFTLSDSN